MTAYKSNPNTSREKIQHPEYIKLRALPPLENLIQIAAKVLGKPAHHIENYWQHPKSRTDAADILIRQLDGEWWNKLDLTETRNGGFQQDANTRIFELREALKDHGLFIACLQDASGERTVSYYRLVWQDEIKYSRTGRIQPFSMSAESKKPKSAPSARQPSLTRKQANEPEPIAAQPAQSDLFGKLPFIRAMKSNFVSHETGAA